MNTNKKKALYVAPTIKVIGMDGYASILAGSGTLTLTPGGDSTPKTDENGDIYIGAKKHFWDYVGQWDDKFSWGDDEKGNANRLWD